MYVTFIKTDRSVLLLALAVCAKQAEAAKKTLEKLRLDTMQVDTLLARCERAGEFLAEFSLHPDDGRVLEGDIEIAEPLTETMRTACWLILEETGKVAKKQTELLIDTAPTDARSDHLRSLCDRLDGQHEMRFDSREFREALAEGLEREGFEAEVTPTGVRATARA